jgi:hypothetical protein
MSSGGGGLQKLCHCICKKKAESQPREWPAMFALTLICNLAVVLQAMRVNRPACGTACRLTAFILNPAMLLLNACLFLAAALNHPRRSLTGPLVPSLVVSTFVSFGGFAGTVC